MDSFSTVPKWVEIDLEAISHNYFQLRRLVGKDVKILGVVKADAYGHGAVEVARTLEQLGIDMLGVTTVEEGRQLREGRINAPVLVFGPFLPEEAQAVADLELTATIASRRSLDWLDDAGSKSNRKISVHLKVETGMGRLGYWPDEIADAALAVLNSSGLVLEGIYSHLSTAMWKNKTNAKKQFGLFKKALEELERAGIKGITRHIANSAALLDLPEMHLDMVRTGTLLYGQYPSPWQEGMLDLKDPWVMKARVIHLRELPPGHGVGYGRAFVTSRKTTVALLPVGFADGLQVEPVFKPASFLELLKGIAKLVLQYLNHPRMRPAVVFPGGQGRVIGKVGMQMTMVDVTGIPGLEIGTTAQVPARRTAVSPAVPRRYIHKGEKLNYRQQILLEKGW
ncbi:MAG: alanine racemase [Peptococcaceae bacterium]|jgi:alanine racemase|nr:alanine racemase [Peptococcaceae bacterium]MDH7523740.1 alanine racemase [Peptococcaceae bacterium]